MGAKGYFDRSTVLCFLIIAACFRIAIGMNGAVAASIREPHDPGSIGFVYNPSKSSVLYRGDGSTTRTIMGIEFWDVGFPLKIYREVGYLRPKSFKMDIDKPDEAKAVEISIARSAAGYGGDAVIPGLVRSGRGGLAPMYTLIKYVDHAPPDAVIVHSDSPRGPDDNVVANLAIAPPQLIRRPYFSGFPGESGQALVRICVGADGKFSEPPSMAFSSAPRNNRINSSLLRLAQEMRFKPATVNQQPVNRCFLMPFSWF
jgi:hypothetical protein